MARTSARDVLAIMKGSTLTRTEIDPHVKAANIIVDNITGSYDADELEQIELWLAAHFAAVADPQIASENIGGANVTYHGKTGMGLDGSVYGQRVKLLDRYRKLEPRKKAGLKHLKYESGEEEST